MYLVTGCRASEDNGAPFRQLHQLLLSSLKMRKKRKTQERVVLKWLKNNFPQIENRDPTKEWKSGDSGGSDGEELGRDNKYYNCLHMFARIFFFISEQFIFYCSNIPLFKADDILTPSHIYLTQLFFFRLSIIFIY